MPPLPKTAVATVSPTETMSSGASTAVSPRLKMGSTIHKTAVIEHGARIGDGVTIGPFVVVGPHVEIGDGCQISPHVVIEGHTTIGPRCKIFSGAVIGSIPQDLKYQGGPTYLQIGENNLIRECVTINGTEGEAEATRIGNGNLLMAYVHVAHNCQIGSHTILANGVTLAGHVEIEDHAVIGGLVGIHQFVKIGSLAMIGGKTKVVQDVLPFVTVDGNPAQSHGLNMVGLKRSGRSPKTIGALRNAYRLLFRDGKTVDGARQEILDNPSLAEVPEVRHMLDFLEKSQRGLVRD